MATKVNTINEDTTNYDASLGIESYDESNLNLVIYPNPAQDFIAIQSNMVPENLKLELINELGQVILTNQILQGSTLSIMEIHTLYDGIYFLRVSKQNNSKTYKIIIKK